MEHKEHPRIARTRQLLQTAFLKLLTSAPLHAISIRDLCREAGVNRTTFYNHYGSQYDLLQDISQRFLDSIAARLDSADAASRESVHARVAMVLEYISQNRELAVLLLNNNLDPTFARRIFSLPQIGDLLSAALGSGLPEQERAATVSFVIHGSYRLLQEWINQDDRLPPREEAELILGLAQRVCYQGGRHVKISDP